MATVLAVCTSARKGEQKTPQPTITLRPAHGAEGDAHAGTWHRQVSLLGKASVDKLQAKVDVELTPGVFAENILISGDATALKVGDRLQIGTAELEVTQIGKECHADCVIRQKAGDCVMPREGVFARVLTGGEVKSGDEVAGL
ncbi:MAG: MOSC domain-containing protein [Oscillospiraceae bacterium]|nr:MOSC domain-containing protein [Oscillospiraceae bacterium]